MTEPGSVESEEAIIAPLHARGPLIERDGHSPFPLVGIGASAGGFEAFRQLLQSLPAETGMAFVLVMHLDPRRESRLAELLSRATAMPVLEAAHGLAVRPDHVYVIQPNTNLAISQGVLLTTPRAPGRGPHLPVDFLFRSLAEEQQGRAVGVVLSGTGSDGTLGLCEIKAVGGITFAQEEESAGQPGMPHSASESGCVDFVLPVEEIARRLVEVGKHPYLSTVSLDQKLRHLHEETQYRRILDAVRVAKGVDFSLYRDTTIKRRILRRMALHGQEQMGDYARRLEGDRAEIEALYHDLLINVTSFFRDPVVFDALKERVFPDVVREKFPGAPIRVWVPGCSSGQEAYSIAIALIEFFDDKPARPPIQIFATDLSDPPSLDKARAGIYPDSIEAELSPDRLRRFFRKQEQAYRVEKSVRDMCVFARQNLVADPPFSHLDLISCRNVLIYLSTPLQKRVVPTFHYALNSPGYLLLGSAETVGENGDLFEPVDREHRIYARKATPSRMPLHVQAGPIKGGPAAPGRPAESAAASGPDLQKVADRLILGRFGPPGVLVDENLDVIQFRGRTSPYLEAPPGEPTRNLLKMAREGLLIGLREAMAEARTSNQPARREHVRVLDDGRSREIVVEVTPIRPFGNERTACWLVLFQPQEAGGPGPGPIGPPAAETEVPDAPEAAAIIHALRQELGATREYMQSMVEHQDASNEELRSANEEILSSNEELQSTNEELETAKEELQSANEELTTVNEQLQQRNLELSQANNDLTNLLSSTNIPVIMVGADLRVRLFTPSARRAMNLLPTDIGRPLGDLQPAIDVPDLTALVVDVIERVQPVEREVRDRGRRWHSLRIHPYRTAERGVEGAVIVLVDVHETKMAEESLREADRRKDEFLAMLAHELRNPIAPIRNAIEIMRRAEHDPGAMAGARDVLNRQVTQLSRIVDDLIDVSRIVERKIELRRQRVELDAVVDLAVESSRSFIESCRHRLEVSLPPGPLTLEADPARLTQVLVNLLNNAAKYTKPGGRIWLMAEHDPAGATMAGGDEVRITVRDTGMGIEPQLLPHIFDMFSQGDRVYEHSRGGLGIGLTLVQSLIQMHEGRIEARSGGLGEGSEFVVHLPLAAPAAGPSADSPRAAPVAPPARRRVLVVDDNEDQAQSLGMLLQILGHEVEMAHDGPGAIEAAARFRPDIGLIDIGLPGMNGYGVARRLRAMPGLEDVVLVAQTGWGQESDRRRSEEAGFDHHVVKPLDLERLQGILAAAPPSAPRAKPEG